MSDLKRLIGEVLARKSAVFDAPELQRWLPSAASLSSDKDDLERLHYALIARLTELAGGRPKAKKHASSRYCRRMGPILRAYSRPQGFGRAAPSAGY